MVVMLSGTNRVRSRPHPQPGGCRICPAAGTQRLSGALRCLPAL